MRLDLGDVMLSSATARQRCLHCDDILATPRLPLTPRHVPLDAHGRPRRPPIVALDIGGTLTKILVLERSDVDPVGVTPPGMDITSLEAHPTTPCASRAE